MSLAVEVFLKSFSKDCRFFRIFQDGSFAAFPGWLSCMSFPAGVPGFNFGVFRHFYLFLSFTNHRLVVMLYLLSNPTLVPAFIDGRFRSVGFAKAFDFDLHFVAVSLISMARSTDPRT